MAVLIANLFHDVFKNEKTRQAPNPATVSTTVSESRSLDGS